jgi:hypothetical protein
MIFQCKFVNSEYIESLISQKFGTKENMQIVIFFSNIPNKVF